MTINFTTIPVFRFQIRENRSSGINKYFLIITVIYLILKFKKKKKSVQ